MFLLLRCLIVTAVCVFNGKSEPTLAMEVTETTLLNSSEPTTTEALNVTLTGCDNCSDLITTTTESPFANATKSKKRQRSRYNEEANICTCNLQTRFCDVNCCCDPDCTAPDKSMFGYCEIDENRYFDDRYCNYIKYIYVNNTPFKWEVNQNGLFCVISSNLPKSHLLQREQPIKSLNDLKLQTPFWDLKIEPLNDKLQLLGQKNYAFGDPIMIVTNTSKIDLLRVPKGLLTQPCLFQENVAFLKDGKHLCSQADISDGNPALSLAPFFQGFKVIANPKLVNLTKAKGSLYHNCPKNVCIEIEAKLCDIYWNNCSELKNVTSVNFHCSFDLKGNVNFCKNAPKKIHYKLWHNGTLGLYKVELLAALENFTFHFGGENFEFIQEFSLEFLWMNQTKNYSEILSGNPGYIIGKPILAAFKESRRNSSRFLDNFLAFPGSIGARCARNETHNTPLEFGYNLRTKCALEETLRHNFSRNATDTCKEIQRSIFHLWGIPTSQINQSLVFGFFGNALADQEEDWNDVLFSTNASKHLNRTLKGGLEDKNTTLVCYNTSTFLDVQIFYSRVDFKTVLNQNKILGISYKFGNLEGRRFTLQKNGSLKVALELTSQVRFHDVTSKKVRKFVDPLSLEIRLPYDFFYPFIKVGSGARAMLPNISLLLICSLYLIK